MDLDDASKISSNLNPSKNFSQGVFSLTAFLLKIIVQITIKQFKYLNQQTVT